MPVTKVMEGEGFEPPNPKERIYSPPRLASSLPFQVINKIWRETESNRRHMELQSIALPTELLNHNKNVMMAVSTGIEPAISCVTGRRVNRYTTRPLVKRRKRDSNPREPLSPCRFSRPIPSAGLGYSSTNYR